MGFNLSSGGWWRKVSKLFVFLVLSFIFSSSLFAKRIDEKKSLIPLLLPISGLEMLFPIPLVKDGLEGRLVSDGILADKLTADNYLDHKFKDSYIEDKEDEYMRSFFDQEHVVVVGMFGIGKNSNEEEEEEKKEEEGSEVERGVHDTPPPSPTVSQRLQQPVESEDEYSDMPPLEEVSSTEGEKKEIFKTPPVEPEPSKSGEEELRGYFSKGKYELAIKYLLKDTSKGAKLVFRLACEFNSRKIISIIRFLNLLEFVPHELLYERENKLLKDISARNFNDEDSDTDSEDEENYVFVDPLDHLRIRGGVLRGMVDDEPVTFREEFISPNHDCGFTGLGASRESLNVLFNHVNEEGVRIFIAPEIVDAVINGDFSLAGISDFNESIRNDIDKLKKFCSRQDVVEKYLEELMKNHSMWIGQKVMILYALAKDIRLYIWSRPNEASSELVLLADSSRGVDNPTNTIHLLYTDRGTHFNLLVETGQNQSTNQNQVKVKKENVDKKPIPMVAHYRGVHFHKKHFNRKKRKWFLLLNKLRQQGIIPAEGLFSQASYELADFSLVPDGGKVKDYYSLLKLLQVRKIKLKEKSGVVKNKICVLKKEEPYSGSLFTIDAQKVKKLYISEYCDFLSCYVNNYSALLGYMEKAGFIRKFSGSNYSAEWFYGKKCKIKGIGRSGNLSDEEKKVVEKVRKSKARVRERWQLLIDLGFTELPLVSTSKSRKTALGYSVAEYCKGNKFVLNPEYQPDGHPRFPYLGIVYIILHPKDNGELKEGNSSSISELIESEKIHIIHHYKFHEERVFIGHIDAAYVPIAIVIRAPNFSHEYKTFYKEKYGLDEWWFNHFKKQLKEGEISNIEQAIINHVVNFQVKKLLKVVSLIVKIRGGDLK